MPAAKTFNNIIIGQYALTGVPTKVYVNGRFLTITDPDDVENPLIGFGMDENGAMIQFDYVNVERLNIAGNEVTIDAYNKGMEKRFGADEEGGEKEPEDEKAPEEEEEETEKGPPGMSDHYNPAKLKDLVSEISKDEADAKQLAIDAEIAAGKAKIKSAKDAEKKLKKQSIEDGKINELGPGEIGRANPFDEPEGKDPHHEELVNLVQGMAGNAYDNLASSIPVKDTNEMMEWIYSLSDGEAMAMTRRIKKGDFGLYENNINEYTFGTGDIVKDINPKCPHYGSKGIVQKTMDIPDKGIVAIYTVTNNGKTFKPGDKLSKTVDQLEKV